MKTLVLLTCLLHISLAAVVELGDSEATLFATNDPRSTCMHVPFSLCIGNDRIGVNHITSDNIEKGLVGWWTFDTTSAYDHSRQLTLLQPVPTPGPGFQGGFSARFNSTSGSTIPHNEHFESEDFSLSFWLFPLQDAVGAFRTLVHKGDDQEHPAFSLIVWPESRRIRLRLGVEFHGDLEETSAVLDSISVLPLRRWTHIGVIIQGRIAGLYINGNLEVELVLPGLTSVTRNSDDFHVGADPFRLGLESYFDELKIYNVALNAEQMRAMGASAFPGISNVHIGCKKCTRDVAAHSCQDGFHLCNDLELKGSALIVAREMSWIDVAKDPKDVKIWAADEKEQVGEAVGICCAN